MSPVEVPVGGIAVVAAGVTGPADLLAPVAPDPGPDWFDPVRHLGRRGWKYLTPATRYLLAAAALAGTEDAEPPPPEAVGVVTGTSDAIDAVHAEFDHIVRTEGVGGLSPAQLPGFSVNIPASQLAIATAARAFSVTLTNPGVAGLEAVLFAVAAIRAGRAAQVLATATEQGGNAVPRGGAVAIRLAVAAPDPVAHVLGGASRFVPVDADGSVAADRFAALLRGTSGPVRLAVSGSDAAAVRDLVTAGLARSGVDTVPVETLGAAGEYGTVSGLLQLAGLLCTPGPALAVTSSGAGHLAAVALRVGEKATPIVG